MEIKTKFNVGDEVYYIDDNTRDAKGREIRKIVQGKILHCYEIPELGSVYEVGNGSGYCVVRDDMLFHTYDEVKEYIKKKRTMLFRLLKLINHGKSTK